MIIKQLGFINAVVNAIDADLRSAINEWNAKLNSLRAWVQNLRTIGLFIYPLEQCYKNAITWFWLDNNETNSDCVTWYLQPPTRFLLIYYFIVIIGWHSRGTYFNVQNGLLRGRVPARSNWWHGANTTRLNWKTGCLGSLVILLLISIWVEKYIWFYILSQWYCGRGFNFVMSGIYYVIILNILY